MLKPHKNQHTNRIASPEDLYAGEVLKNKRKELGLTQVMLAKIIGISFQQLQKYERGINRMSASRLVQFSRALNSNLSDFIKHSKAISELRERKDIDVITPFEKEVVKIVRNANSKEQRERIIKAITAILEENND